MSSNLLLALSLLSSATLSAGDPAPDFLLKWMDRIAQQQLSVAHCCLIFQPPWRDVLWL
jgi:hypothetical protein